MEWVRFCSILQKIQDMTFNLCYSSKIGGPLGSNWKPWKLC